MRSHSSKTPFADWRCREIIDAKSLGEDGEGRCEFCNTRIRWIHLLDHDDFRSMQAGCCCAERLCFGYDASGEERRFKNRTARLMRFVELKRWRRSRKNPANLVREVKTTKGRRWVTIFLKDARYGIVISSLRGEPTFHHVRYVTQHEALIVAFDLVEELNEGA